MPVEAAHNILLRDHTIRGLPVHMVNGDVIDVTVRVDGCMKWLLCDIAQVIKNLIGNYCGTYGGGAVAGSGYCGEEYGRVDV